MNKLTPKNSKSIYKFEGTNMYIADIKQEPEYINLKNNRDELHTQLKEAQKELQETKDIKNKLLEKVNKIDSDINEILKIGILDYLTIKTVKEGA